MKLEELKTKMVAYESTLESTDTSDAKSLDKLRKLHEDLQKTLEELKKQAEGKNLQLNGQNPFKQYVAAFEQLESAFSALLRTPASRPRP